MATPGSSALSDYINQYGERLQSLLGAQAQPGTAAAAAPAAAPMRTAAAQTFPDGAMPAAPLRSQPMHERDLAAPAPPMRSPAQGRRESALAGPGQSVAADPGRGGGYSFRDLW